MTARLLAAILSSMLIVAGPSIAARADDWTPSADKSARVASYSPAPVPDDTASPPVNTVRDGEVIERAQPVTPPSVAGRTAPLTDLLGITLALAPRS